MNIYTLHSCIIRSGRGVREAHDAVIARAARQCGITRPEADVLLFLSNNPELNTARDVARYRGFSKAYVSKAIEPLARKGLLSICTDPRDRRRQLLTITGGAEIARQLCQEQQRFLRSMAQGIPEADLEAFMRATEAMCSNAKNYLHEVESDDGAQK